MCYFKTNNFEYLFNNIKYFGTDINIYKNRNKMLLKIRKVPTSENRYFLLSVYKELSGGLGHHFGGGELR